MSRTLHVLALLLSAGANSRFTYAKVDMSLIQSCTEDFYNKDKVYRV